MHTMPGYGYPLGHGTNSALSGIGLDADPDAPFMNKFFTKNDFMMILELFDWISKWEDANGPLRLSGERWTDEAIDIWLYEHVAPLMKVQGAGKNKIADEMHEKYPGCIIIVDGVRYY